MPASQGSHAIVLGGGIAGLLATRSLSRHFTRITLVEKGLLARSEAVRTTVPQGAHVHAMLARGLQIVEDYFPGITDEITASGAALVGPADVKFYAAGWRLPYESPIQVLCVTRPFLEWKIADRVRALPNVTVLENTEATGITYEGSTVAGVKLDGTNLSADFIVDARGRASNLADWMKQIGFESPPHATSPLASTYCSLLMEPLPGEPRPVVHQIVKMEDKLGVLIFPVENGKVLLSVGSSSMVKLPTDLDGLLAFFQTLPVPDAYTAISRLRPLTSLKFSRYTASVRRNYEQLARLPENIVALGDAVASFNPIFGQGMTVAAIEAECLHECLTKHDRTAPGFTRQYYNSIKPIVDLAWGPPDLEAKRNNSKAQPVLTRFLLWYTNRMQFAAARSVLVSKTIAEVQNMLAPPSALFSPKVFLSVLFA